MTPERSRPRLLTVWVLTLLAASPPLFAGSRGLQVDRLSVQDGLSQTTVWTVLQDARGFIWMGTEEGLNRYDGYGFQIFEHDPQDPRSLAESEVFTLIEDPVGILWVGTSGGGLDRFHRENESFEHHRHDPEDPHSLSNDHVLSLTIGPEGALWVGTEGGLDRLRADGSFERLLPPTAPDTKGPKVWSTHFDRNGELWLATDHGLFRNVPGHERFASFPHRVADPRSLPGEFVYTLAEGPTGYLWVGTNKGLCLFDTAAGACEVIRNPETQKWPQDAINSLHIDRAGALWVGSVTQGLFRRAPGAEGFENFRHNPADSRSLSDDSILSLHEDRSGTLWLGTYVGTNKYDLTRDAFTVYRHRPGQRNSLSSNSVWALLPGRRGELWVGTFNHGLNRFDPARQRVTTYSANSADPRALPSGAVNGLWEDRGGYLWVATWGGLARFDPAEESFTSWHHDPADPKSLASELVHTVLEDSTGRLWVGTYKGVQVFDRTTGQFQRSADFPGVPIQILFEDQHGTLWAGSDRSSLFQRSVGETFTPFEPEEMAPLKIASIHEDATGHLWVGTYGRGLYHFDGARRPVARYGKAEGLPNNSVLGILSDQNNQLWLATNNGLASFDPIHKTFSYFDVDDGLQGNVFTSNSSCSGPEGELFFGGVQGLTAFHPADVQRNPHPPTVVLTDFRLFDRSVPLRSSNPRSPLESVIEETQELMLSHRDYVFSLEFAALHFKAPRRNRYAYRLQGFDTQWIETDAMGRSVRYSNLTSGDYVFQVKASNADGVWNEEGRSLRIRVLPPPWKTWWAYLLYTLAGGAVLLAGWRSATFMNRRLERLVEARTAQIEELNAELKRRNDELEGFTYTVSHDLKSPLITVQGFLGLLRQDLNAGNIDRVHHDCDRISRAATNMQELLNDLLELSRIGRLTNPPQLISLEALVAEVLELLDGPLRERGIDITVGADLPTVYGDHLRLREVLQNLVENAIKYLGDQETPKIEIGVTTREGERTFFVRDNGIGLAPEHRGRIFGLFQQLSPKSEGTGIGLALVRRIVEFHGGRIWAESAGLGQGSTFYFTLADEETEPVTSP